MRARYYFEGMYALLSFSFWRNKVGSSDFVLFVVENDDDESFLWDWCSDFLATCNKFYFRRKEQVEDQNNNSIEYVAFLYTQHLQAL